MRQDREEEEKKKQKAEYQNRKKGMATGRTEEEICTAGTAVWGNAGRREKKERKAE